MTQLAVMTRVSLRMLGGLSTIGHEDNIISTSYKYTYALRISLTSNISPVIINDILIRFGRLPHIFGGDSFRKYMWYWS